MQFLVELDRVNPGNTPTPEGGHTFIQQVIFPTLARAEQLMAEGKILSGGAVAGRVSLRFIVEAQSPEDVDRIVTSLPVWTVAETRVTPLIPLAARREHVQTLLEGFAAAAARS
jgi:muconolactone delta-isomerase